MAARAEVTERIATCIEALRTMLDDLPEVAEEWTELADGERVSWSLDWDQVMGTHLPLLDQHCRSNDMTQDQHDRYMVLLNGLREALPVLERLHLQPPTVPLDREPPRDEAPPRVS